jgi:hypothetical protein
VAWAVAPVVPFLVTSLRSVRFLGEAERYPEYAVAPVSVLAGTALAGAGWSAWWIAAIYVALLVPAFAYSLARQRWNSRRGIGPEMDELTAFLRSIPEGTVVVPVPWYSAYVLAPQLELRFLVSNDGSVWYRDYDRIFTAYPWPVLDRTGWREGYGAGLVLVETPLLAEAPAGFPPYDFSDLPLVFENRRFQVFALGGA